MKSIKEKAIEGYTGSVVFDYEYSKGFEAGANYVLDIIEQALTPQKCLTDIGIDVYPEALIKTALQTIEQLKK